MADIDSQQCQLAFPNIVARAIYFARFFYELSKILFHVLITESQ